LILHGGATYLDLVEGDPDGEDGASGDLANVEDVGELEGECICGIGGDEVLHDWDCPAGFLERFRAMGLTSVAPPQPSRTLTGIAPGVITNWFLGSSRLEGGSLLDAGCSIATLESGASGFQESTLLGSLLAAGPPRALYLNLHEPFCFAAVGVQGGGKSHTLGALLEACLVPFEEEGVSRIAQPMAALVLHYDQSPTSICEATGLVAPAQRLAAMPAAAGGNGGTPPRCLPRERMVVLVSPTYLQQRRAFYGRYCEVRPLLFTWSSLTADHIKRIMRVNETDNQLYVSSMLNILRDYQRDAVLPSFASFLDTVAETCDIKGQSAPLQQRLALLQSIVREAPINARVAHEASDLADVCRPGSLVIVDLTDPLLSSSEANGIFQVLVEQFRTLRVGGCGKVLALDEAHKFMAGEKSDGLSHAVVNCARLMRHDGLRLFVSTQSPLTLAPELLELVSVCAMHRFHSRDWLKYLNAKLRLPEDAFEVVSALQPGNALVFASRAAVATAAPETTTFTARIRQRYTADRGATLTNAAR
jgi:hypothetical protein